jgi:hypothetical protein
VRWLDGYNELMPRRLADEDVASPELTLSGVDVSLLVSWLRAEGLGHSTRAAAYRAQLPDELSLASPAALRRALLRHVTEVQRDRLVSRDDARIWDSYRGLSEPPLSGVAVAALHGVTAADVVSISRRVERVLARRELRVNVAPSPGGRSQRKLAELHTSLVLADPRDVSLAALADLQREHGVMVPSPRGRVERHRRQRGAAVLRRRLQMGHIQTSRPRTSNLPDLDPEFVRAALEVDPSNIWATRDQVAAAVASWELERRPITDVPARLRLDAWRLRLRFWREDEDIRALYASRVIRGLAGQTLDSLPSLRDDAIVLGAHGYQHAAKEACDAALYLLPRVKAPPEMVEVERGAILSRQAVTAPPASGRAMAERRMLLDRALESYAEGNPAEIPTQTAGMARNLIDIELTHHRLSERPQRGRPGRPGISRERIDATEQAVDGLSDPLRSLTWRVTKLRWALAVGDAETFAVGAREFIDQYHTIPEPLRNQARRYRTLLTQAQGRRSRIWRALDLPPVPGDHRTLLRPAEPVIWIEE